MLAWAWVWVWVWSALEAAWTTAVHAPLAHLYLHGPQLHGYGFWEGLPPEDICARLTGTGTGIWLKNSDECEVVLRRHTHGFVLGVTWMIGAVLLLRFLDALLMRYMVVQPLLQRMHLSAPALAQ